MSLNNGLLYTLQYVLRHHGISPPQYALPHLRQRQGNIINLSSLVGSIGQKNAAPYVATKVNYKSR